MRSSRAIASRTGMPPLPAPTWKTWATCRPSSSLGDGPFTGLVPDLVARQPAPRGLDGEDAGEAGGVPAAEGAGAALAPQAQGLALEKMRAVLQRRLDARLGRHRRVAGHQACLQFVDVVPRLEGVLEDQRT